MSTFVNPRPSEIFSLPPLVAFDGTLSPAANVYSAPKVIIVIVKRGYQESKHDFSWTHEARRPDHLRHGFNVVEQVHANVFHKFN